LENYSSITECKSASIEQPWLYCTCRDILMNRVSPKDELDEDSLNGSTGIMKGVWGKQNPNM